MTLTLKDKLHMVHRCWRLRFKSEVTSIRYVRNTPIRGMTVLDIGANKGVFCIYMSRAVGPDGTLVAFEAQPELGSHLDRIKEGFALDNMTLVNEALSSKAGTLTLRRPVAGSGLASFHTDGDDLESIEVPVIRLDDYVAENALEPVGFIKCDVEGHELDVFRGGESMLRRDMPTLLFESHDSEISDGALFSFLTGLGYDGFFFHVSPEDHRSLLHKGRGRFVHFSEYANYDHVHPDVHHRNYVFVKKGQQP